MKTNYVLFVALSFLILFGWNYAVVKKGAPAAPPAATTPAAGGGAPQVFTPAAPTLVEKRLEKTVGRHRVEFNQRGAGVLQWWIEDGVQAPLVLADADGEHPFSAFPGLDFTAEEGAFTAARPDGLKVRQSYAVNPDGYLHAVTISLENAGKEPVDASFSLGWGPGIESGDGAPRDGAAEQRALALEGEKLLKLKSGSVTGAYRWFGVDARYFLAAFLNEGAAPLTLSVAKKEKLFSVRRTERLTLAPGEKRAFTQRFYLGPKGYDDLASLNLGLERAVNFGMFSRFGRWIHRALISLKKTTNNYGWAIILITVFAQILLSPLTISSFKHGQKMKALQPQMKRLQEMYKSDPRRQQAETLALYQRHGLRFMGLEGCLPVLIQMPVFFALYAVLSKTYELRHAPWVGWIKDLSRGDPFYILPVLMGLAMFGQQKVTMSSADPTQKQMMYIMPVIFTFFFLKMPSGLVLYWLTQSLLAFALQLFLLKRDQSKKEAVL